MMRLAWTQLRTGADRLWAALRGWIAHDAPSMSASIAFFAAFSLAPILVVAVSIASFFFGVEAVQGRLFSSIESVVGAAGAEAVQAMLANAWLSGDQGWSGALSLLAVFIGATATFAELNRALNRIWDVDPSRRVVIGVLRVRLLSFGIVIGTGFLMVVLLIADALLTHAQAWLWGGRGTLPLLQQVQQCVSFVFLCVAFSVLLKVLPDVVVAWREAITGGVAAAVLFAIGKHLFARYLAYAGTANAFGAAGSLAVLMMWLFFSAAVFLFGAELAAASRRPADKPGYMPM